MPDVQTPPQDVDLERAVLDACLQSPEALAAVRPILRPQAFYWEQHRSIYRAVTAVADAGAGVDLFTVSAELERNGAPPNGIPWRSTVVDILGQAPVWLHAPTYALRLTELESDRRVASLARQVEADPGDPELRNLLLAALTEPRRPGGEGGPLDLDLAAFMAARSEMPEALIGDTDDVLLPAGGLLIEFAKGGRGKTTLTLDFAFHAASGVPWLGFPIPRPLRVLFIENEGPRESFRAKIARKAEGWPHPIRGALRVHVRHWGSFSLAEPAHLAELRASIEDNGIDVVIGDPLDSLGLKGVGSPEETREFLGLLARAGLTRDVAFVLLAHPRKEITTDELDEISGAWGGRPDTMLRLARLPGNRARLSFPKFRWSRSSDHEPLILAFDPETDAFTVVARGDEEPGSVVERDYHAEIAALLGDGEWRTAPEIGKAINARRKIVEGVLLAWPETFIKDRGNVIGRHANATVWHLASDRLQEPPDETEEPPE